MEGAPPSQDFIRYDLLTQKALRGVVRDVLSRIAREGVPGEHHFYISFRTTDPTVRLSQRLRERYPAEMTIVLQHQFWDLDVDEEGFEVGLSFGNVPEKLSVPFASITGFFDPSVQFGLKFDNPDAAEDDVAEAGAAPHELKASANAPVEIDRKSANEEEAPNKPSDDARDPESPPDRGAQVVSLDKFRKK